MEHWGIDQGPGFSSAREGGGRLGVSRRGARVAVILRLVVLVAEQTGGLSGATAS